VTAGRTGRRSTGWPPPTGAGSGSWYPAGRDHDRTGQDPPGRRARVPDHVAAGERPAAATAGHRRQRARRRPGVPGRRPVPAARPVQADHAGGVSAETQLRLLREVAEAVAYAHGNRIVHRGLTPHAVWCTGRPAASCGFWWVTGAARARSRARTDRPVGQRGHRADGRGRRRRPGSAMMRPGPWTWTGGWPRRSRPPRRVEPRRRPDPAGRVRARGAGLLRAGGRPAAADRAALRDRLHRDDGLDLAADLPQVPSAVRALVLEPPGRGERAAARRPVLPRAAGRRGTGPGRAGRGRGGPAGGGARAVIDGRFRLERRLGAGPPPSACWSRTCRSANPARTPPGCSRSRWTTRRRAGSPARPGCWPG